MLPRSPAQRLGSLLLTAAMLLVAERADAQDPADLPATPSADIALREGLGQNRPYWHGSGPERLFAAGSFDAGIIHLRPAVALGWGKPHWQWLGVEGWTQLARGGGSSYVGVRAALPYLDVRVGGRYVFPIEQHFLEARDEFEREDIEARVLGRSRYLAGEAELSGKVDVLWGSAFGVATLYALTEIPDGAYVFEESLRVVVAPPYLYRARAGYLFHLGWANTMKLGAAAELIGIPGRDNFVVRAGPAVSVALTHHLEATGGILAVLASPDELGIVGADLGQIGLRYRWATGDRWAEFP